MICHPVHACMEVLEELIMVEDFDNDVLQEWSTKNPDLIYLIESSGNKLLFFPRPIPIPGAGINQVGFLSMGPNNVNAGRSDRENVVVMDFTIRNKRIRKSNKNAKVGSKVQPNIVITALVFYWPTTTTDILVLVFSIFVSVCHPLILVCGGRPLFSQV